MDSNKNIVNRLFALKAFLKKKVGGFTLIEVLVVVAISAVLSTIVILYSNADKNEISLSVEAVKISQTIFQAKTLAISTYANSSSSCGYGVSFDYTAGTYSIFAYNPAGAPPCPSAAGITNISLDEMKQYSDATWKVPIASGVSMKLNDDSLALVLFYPPDPTTFISRDINPDADGKRTFTDASSPLSKIYLEPIGNASATEAISVNLAGQITL